MRYSKKYNIRRRIISHNDLIALSHFFEDLAETQGGECNFKVHFRDESYLHDGNSSIFEGSFFKSKNVESIQFEYTKPDYTGDIRLEMQEISLIDFDSSFFVISSKDEVWLNATFAKLKELVDVISLQSIFRRAVHFPWIIATCALIPILAWKMMPLLGYTYGYRPLLPDGTPDLSVRFISEGSFFILAAIFSFCLVFSLCLLYPEQEFAFGISRHPRRVKLRKALGWILATIIIPMALTILL